ncbi:hypothetical protein V9K67_09530 [Paraflavisolibacter sp. H34]|uniref:hypothetical protein n=1 Tax=Huijunlia imazamoxiresistens TaxID=3127457 RepID=UPI003019AF99
MKKILFALALMIGTSTFAADLPVNEKVAKMFSETFPQAEKVKWYEKDQAYEVLFENNGITCRATYEADGSMTTLRRDYSGKDLPVYIKAKLKEKHPDKMVFGVTEMNSSDGVSYTITLENDKNWVTVKATDAGDMTVLQKLKKAS